MNGASGVLDNKARPPRVPLNNGQGRRPGHRHPPCLLPPGREWGAPGYCGDSPLGPRGEQQGRSGSEGKEKEVGLDSPAAPESGSLSPEVVSFHSRRRARGAPLRRPPSHATTHRALIRPNAPRVLIGCREETAEAAKPLRMCRYLPPPVGSGR